MSEKHTVTTNQGFFFLRNGYPRANLNHRKMNITFLSGRMKGVKLQRIMHAGFKKVSVGCISEMAALMGFS